MREEAAGRWEVEEGVGEREQDVGGMKKRWTVRGGSQQAAEGGRSAASTGEKGLARGSGEWG